MEEKNLKTKSSKVLKILLKMVVVLLLLGIGIILGMVFSGKEVPIIEDLKNDIINNETTKEETTENKEQLEDIVEKEISNNSTNGSEYDKAVQEWIYVKFLDTKAWNFYADIFSIS